MKALVLCANDSIKAVVLEDEDKALWNLEVLKEDYYRKFKHNFTSREEFNDIIFWHLHEVPVLE